MFPARRVLYASFDAVPAPKGASVHILQTARAIAARAEVHLLTLLGSLTMAPLPQEVRHQVVAPPDGNFLDRALYFGEVVGRQLLAEPYDVVQVRSIWEGTPALLLQPHRGYRLIYEANGLPSVELKYHYPGIATQRGFIPRLRAQERALLRASARVITQSNVTRKYLRSLGASGERLRVIPNGVDPQQFGAIDRPLPALPQLLYLGTLAPWQGVPFLIEAVRLVRDQREAGLRVVGPGRREWRKACERLLGKLALADCVELLPPVPPERVPEFIAAADICVAPLALTDRNLIQGCCPVKIFEYMATGRPIVAADFPAVREILVHERTALLYKPDKPRRLAEAILRLLDEPELAARIGRAAAVEVRRRFTWERHNTAISGLYEEVLAETG
jgi:glycosyltransferase involved in cell wall biosynthesis